MQIHVHNCCVVSASGKLTINFVKIVKFIVVIIFSVSLLN